MDSGNSGSMQSSSTGGGDDQEYDSRVDHSSISAFLNNNTPLSQQPRHHVDHVIPPFTNNNNNNNNNSVSSISSNHHQQNMLLDPLYSNYQLDPNLLQRSLLNNLDNMVWSSKASRSDLEGFISSSQNQQQQQQPPFDLSSQLSGQTKGVAAFSMPPPETSSSRGGLLLSDHDQAHHNNNNNNNNNNMVRNPKKRSRASRRAPTTVLTTDTTNFRAMVQEFTGIPAPPFTSSSPFPRTRLDLFGNSSSPSQPPPYLLRPFAQKLIHPFPPPPSTTTSIPTSMVDNNTSNNLSTTNSTPINYQQHPLNMMMNNNQILSFQSILQNTKYPLGNSHVLAPSKTTQPSSLEIPNTVDNSHLKMRMLEELGLSHDAHVHHHNMVSSTSTSSPSGAALSRVINNMGNPNSSVDWVQRTGSTLSSNNNNDGDDDHGGVLRSLNGTANYNNNNINVHGEKGPECGVAARSEGMVESWINCSSD